MLLGMTRVEGKTHKWNEKRFIKEGFRYVPNGVVRKGAYIAKNVVLMPSFVNVGAYVDQGSMIDTWASVGSCAQIGKNCHISGGAGIGGVLEPMQANPTIIEDDCFIGARAEIAEGVIVGKRIGTFYGSLYRRHQHEFLIDLQVKHITERFQNYSVDCARELCQVKITLMGLLMYTVW